MSRVVRSAASGCGAYIVGTILTVLSAWVLGSQGFRGLAWSAPAGVFFGLGLYMLWRARPSGDEASNVGLMVAVAGGLTACLVGPLLSSMWWRQAETSEWALVQHSDRVNDWRRYEDKVPEYFRRPEYGPRQAMAQARTGLRERHPRLLRALLARWDKEYAGDAAYDPPRAEARKALTHMYREALERLKEERSGADPTLRSGFRSLLETLAEEQAGKVGLVFKTTDHLEPPPGAQAALDALRKAQGDGPVVDPGEAFSKRSDDRRRAKFQTAMQDAFNTVFATDLIELTTPTEKSRVPSFHVSSTVQRTARYFRYTRGEDGRLIGYVYSIQVKWEFRLVDAEGRQLYRYVSNTEPLDHVRLRLRESDPNWAPYSILMDSAYYNFARDVAIRLGLMPPAERTTFTFD